MRNSFCGLWNTSIESIPSWLESVTQILRYSLALRLHQVNKLVIWCQALKLSVRDPGFIIQYISQDTWEKRNLMKADINWAIILGAEKAVKQYVHNYITYITLKTWNKIWSVIFAPTAVDRLLHLEFLQFQWGKKVYVQCIISLDSETQSEISAHYIGCFLRKKVVEYNETCVQIRPRDQQNVVFIHRWSLSAGSIT